MPCVVVVAECFSAHSSILSVQQCELTMRLPSRLKSVCQFLIILIFFWHHLLVVLRVNSDFIPIIFKKGKF